MNEESCPREPSDPAKEPAVTTMPARRPIEPLDPQLTTIQPGGGVCMSLELAWGYVRRWLLARLFPGYVQRMAALRKGERNACPHAVLDPRDVKFYRNQPGYRWDETDDPFRWRNHLPLVRAGLAEAAVFTTFFLVLAAISYWWRPWTALPWLVLMAGVCWFFRNPKRVPPADAGLVVSPADGVVVSIKQLDYDEFIDGPAVEIGIFLSVFDVHINRVPVDCRVIGMTYRRGKFLNALLAESARENERLTVRLEENDYPHRAYIVRQIAGAIARRIVCWVPPGETLRRGAAFGMIKFGSRTELVLPQEAGMTVQVKEGQRVWAGVSTLVRYEMDTTSRTP